MNIFENFNKAKQKFGENLARQAIEAKIPNQFVYAACKFNVENGTPFKCTPETLLCSIPFGRAFTPSSLAFASSQSLLACMYSRFAIL